MSAHCDTAYLPVLVWLYNGTIPHTHTVITQLVRNYKYVGNAIREMYVKSQKHLSYLGYSGFNNRRFTDFYF